MLKVNHKFKAENSEQRLENAFLSFNIQILGLADNRTTFYVLLTVHIGIILFNDQPDAQFSFVYVYFSSLQVSSIQVLMIRRFNCINTISGICHSM